MKTIEVTVITVQVDHAIWEAHVEWTYPVIFHGATREEAIGKMVCSDFATKSLFFEGRRAVNFKFVDGN